MSEKLSPFEIGNNINEKKGLLDLTVTGYEPYMLNRIMSNTMDTSLFANEMNRHWGLSKDQQYHFYYHGIPKKKRFGKWNKNSDDKDTLEIIKEYYGFSTRKAKSVLTLVLPHIDEIKKALDKGGRHGKGSNPK